MSEQGICHIKMPWFLYAHNKEFSDELMLQMLWCVCLCVGLSPHARNEIPIGEDRNAGFKEGVVSTSNSLDYTKECMENMIEHDASVKEMEAAAVAEACRMYNVPFAALKAITDIVDGEHATEVEFIQNLGKAVDRLKDALHELLTEIEGKTLEEL